MNTGSHQPPQQSPALWQHVCRRLWRVLAAFLGMFIVVMASTIANINTTTTDTPLSKLFIIHLAQTFPISFFSILGFLALLTFLSFIGSRERKASPPSPTNQQGSVNIPIPLADEDEDVPAFGSPEWYNRQLNREFDRMDDQALHSH